MKIIILLAGYGSRLRSSIPKALIKFSNEKCILDYQLEAILNIAQPHDIYMVVGFKKELIMEKAPACNFLYNHKFDRTNTAKSLLLALERIDDDVIWLNGDVFLEYDVIREFSKFSGNCALVNRAATADEEVCYAADKDGYIRHLRKGLGSLAEGEALGVNKMQRSDIKKLVNYLKQVGNQDYFERAIELGIESGLFKFTPVQFANRFTVEMDFQSDYDVIDCYLSMRK